MIIVLYDGVVAVINYKCTNNNDNDRCIMIVVIVIVIVIVDTIHFCLDIRYYVDISTIVVVVCDTS